MRNGVYSWMGMGFGSTDTRALSCKPCHGSCVRGQPARACAPTRPFSTSLARRRTARSSTTPTGHAFATAPSSTLTVEPVRLARVPPRPFPIAPARRAHPILARAPTPSPYPPPRRALPPLTLFHKALFHRSHPAGRSPLAPATRTAPPLSPAHASPSPSLPAPPCAISRRLLPACSPPSPAPSPPPCLVLPPPSHPAEPLHLASVLPSRPPSLPPR